jgi:hypothetical protein
MEDFEENPFEMENAGIIHHRPILTFSVAPTKFTLWLLLLKRPVVVLKYIFLSPNTCTQKTCLN